jgi:hypothetical protein
MVHVEVSLVLPVVSNPIPPNKEGGVEQHVTTKDCCTWEGF